jgi:ATP-dependent protease ClpP protease subunit
MIDIDFEDGCDRLKKGWAARHRWSLLWPEERRVQLGDVDDAAVQSVLGAVATNPDAPVFMSVDSDGGNPTAAFQIYRALRAHPGPVTGFVRRNCHSAAIIALVGADVRLGSWDSTFLVHGISRDLPGNAWPSAAAHFAEAAGLAALDEEIVHLLCLRSRRYGGHQLRQDMRNERILSAEAACLRGLLTRLVECR